jgi:prephenate dehydratase
LVALKIAFQGEHGAYSEGAIFHRFGESVETVPCKSILDVFNLTEVGAVNCGVIPVENSIEGSINETYDLLITTNNKVIGEIVFKVIHCLIAASPVSLEQIKVIYSHPQALAQCKGFLASIGAELVVTYDTAGSVKMIKEQGIKGAAAIASENAARIYGMSVLSRGIEDYGRNYTRFFIISRTPENSQGARKTSIIFSLPHKPGSLFSALEPFARRGINLTRIESRPTKQQPWEYYFFLDFDGDQEDEKSKQALRDLANKAIFLKISGSYTKAKVESEP